MVGSLYLLDTQHVSAGAAPVGTPGPGTSTPRPDTAGPPLLIETAVLATIREDAAAVYPDECCGALLGHEGATNTAPGDTAPRALHRALPLPNHWPGARGSRFLIPAAMVRRVEEYARSQGLELVGFYHSHPDGAPVPSAFDLEHAWPWYSYLIIAVGGIERGTLRCWKLADDRTTFAEQPLLISGEGREEPCRSR